jgi:hypothetical protein
MRLSLNLTFRNGGAKNPHLFEVREGEVGRVTRTLPDSSPSIGAWRVVPCRGSGLAAPPRIPPARGSGGGPPTAGYRRQRGGPRSMMSGGVAQLRREPPKKRGQRWWWWWWWERWPSCFWFFGWSGIAPMRSLSYFAQRAARTKSSNFLSRGRAPVCVRK